MLKHLLRGPLTTATASFRAVRSPTCSSSFLPAFALGSLALLNVRGWNLPQKRSLHSCSTHARPSNGHRRHHSTDKTTGTAPAVADQENDGSVGQQSFAGVPGAQHGDMMIMMYTCKVCETRSARQISKLGYYHGSVVVRCPGCKSLHLISDHLGWFEDNTVDAETLLRERGEAVRGGRLAAGADANVIELSELDLKVLRSKGKSVRIKDGEELDVLPMHNVMGSQDDSETQPPRAPESKPGS